ncbi:hypothetical protein Y032_0296g1707 [Ancylostoma ceylanicum]|uniref:Uncharacterized protein n=1 Tax=Ancylostoma ceylanicum TaxID=53326 RepID=A0A016S4J6_9BILA|nr:hypothetical protein Y032_0296g1707 [Ancylostoma ceylanicum]
MLGTARAQKIPLGTLYTTTNAPYCLRMVRDSLDQVGPTRASHLKHALSAPAFRSRRDGADAQSVYLFEKDYTTICSVPYMKMTLTEASREQLRVQAMTQI